MTHRLRGGAAALCAALALGLLRQACPGRPDDLGGRPLLAGPAERGARAPPTTTARATAPGPGPGGAGAPAAAAPVRLPIPPQIDAGSILSQGERDGVALVLSPQDGVTYRWSIEGGSLISADAGTSVRFIAGEGDALTITCTATNAAGAEARTQLTLLLVPRPSPVRLAAPAVLVSGRGGYQATVVNPEPWQEYDWRMVNGSIQGKPFGRSIAFTAGSPGELVLVCLPSNFAGTEAAAVHLTIPVEAPTEVTAPERAEPAPLAAGARVEEPDRAQLSASGSQLLPAPAVALRLLGPLRWTAGSPQAITLVALDAAGNVASDYAGAVDLLLEGQGRTAPLATVIFAPGPAGSAGVQRTLLALGTAGRHTLVARDRAPTPLAGLLGPLEVVAGPAAALRLGPLPDTATVERPLPLELTPLDASGNETTAPAEVDASSTDPGATFAPAPAGARPGGTIRFHAPGPQQVTLKLRGAPLSITTPAIQVLPAPPTGATILATRLQAPTGIDRFDDQTLFFIDAGAVRLAKSLAQGDPVGRWSVRTLATVAGAQALSVVDESLAYVSGEAGVLRLAHTDDAWAVQPISDVNAASPGPQPLLQAIDRGSFVVFNRRSGRVEIYRDDQTQRWPRVASQEPPQGTAILALLRSSPGHYLALDARTPAFHHLDGDASGLRFSSASAEPGDFSAPAALIDAEHLLLLEPGGAVLYTDQGSGAPQWTRTEPQQRSGPSASGPLAAWVRSAGGVVSMGAGRFAFTDPAEQLLALFELR